MANQYTTAYNPTGASTNRNTNQDVPSNGTPSNGGGYGYGYGGGGSGGSSEPTPEQEKAADNLAAITNYNIGSTKGKAKQGDKVFDIADKGAKLQQLTSTKQNKRNAGNDWYTQQQKLQSVANWLSDTSGNAMYGSFYNDLNDLIARKDDMDDVAVLNQMRENQNQIDNDYYDTIMSNVNARNEMYMDTEANLRELAADYAAQLNNIHPDLAEDIINNKKNTLDTGKTGKKDSDKSSSFQFPDTSYFDSHVRQAVKPKTQGLYRPADAGQQADVTNRSNRRSTSQYSDSANTDYWARVRKGYQRRTQ